jgi:hypothetical protein
VGEKRVKKKGLLVKNCGEKPADRRKVRIKNDK